MTGPGCYKLYPGQDERWARLVASHPSAGVFHSSPWLEALRKTYGYSSVAFTSCPPDTELSDAILFCEIDSWLTGVRLVSLPYSDHCEPLLSPGQNLDALLSDVGEALGRRIRYAEIRPRSSRPGSPGSFSHQSQFLLHTINLDRDIDEIYQSMHKDSVRRKIRRAQREGLELNEGRSEPLLEAFYGLLLQTRRRHRLPPQPLEWFRNLVDCFGEGLTIRVARLGDYPIASMITIRDRHTLVYKYGGSDARYHNTGAVPALFWDAIRDAKRRGLREFDLGRSELANGGLIAFKRHLGATALPISYWRTKSAWPNWADSALKSLAGRQLISHVPDWLFRWSGQVFYRHSG